MKELRVYGWTGWRLESTPAPNGSHQTREIMAAHSIAEVVRASGWRRADIVRQGDWTGNAREIAQAATKPGAIFWRPLDDRSGHWREA